MGWFCEVSVSKYSHSLCLTVDQELEKCQFQVRFALNWFGILLASPGVSFQRTVSPFWCQSDPRIFLCVPMVNIWLTSWWCSIHLQSHRYVTCFWCFRFTLAAMGSTGAIFTPRLLLEPQCSPFELPVHWMKRSQDQQQQPPEPQRLWECCHELQRKANVCRPEDATAVKQIPSKLTKAFEGFRLQAEFSLSLLQPPSLKYWSEWNHDLQKWYQLMDPKAQELALPDKSKGTKPRTQGKGDIQMSPRCYAGFRDDAQCRSTHW